MLEGKENTEKKGVAAANKINKKDVTIESKENKQTKDTNSGFSLKMFNDKDSISDSDFEKF